MILEKFRQQANRAHYGTSFSPEQRGETTVKNYSEELENDLQFIKGIAEKYGKESTEAAGKYQQRYERHFSAWLSSKSNCISPMITGPAKFPTQRAEKYNRWEENKYKYFREWRQKVLGLIERSFKPKETPLTELERAKNDLATREKNHELMKRSNAILRKAKGNDATTQLIAIGLSESLARELQQPGNWWGKGYARFELSNNLANIQRLKDRVAQLEAKASKHASGEQQEMEINGVKVVRNYEADRLQLYFDGKPDAETINKLKRNGWRWSPFGKCWQRKLTPQAHRDAVYLLKS